MSSAAAPQPEPAPPSDRQPSSSPPPVAAADEPAEEGSEEPNFDPEDDTMKNGQSDHSQQQDEQQQDQQQQQMDSLPDLGPSNEQNRPRQAKTVFFHRDGIQHKDPVRLAIHPNRYRGLDTLLTELTDRMPELSYGVRAVFTPKGRDRVASVEDFANQGHYVCSTNQRRAGPLPGQAGQQQPLPPPPAWRGAGGKARNGTAPDPIRPAPRRSQPDSRSYPGSEPDAAGPAPYAPTFRPADCKRIYARKNGEPFKKHIVLLNKRSVRDYEQVLDDLSAMFKMQVRRLYTVDGEPMESLSAIYNGPDHLVVAGSEKFKPMNAWNGSPAPDGAKGVGAGGGGKSQPVAGGRRANNNRDSRSNASKSKGQWRVRVSTQSGPDEHGTSSRVFITVYGRQGSSEPIALSMPIQTDCIVDPFRPGQEDEFEINTGPIGEVMKVRLSHDCSGPAPDWCVSQLVMTDAHTGEQLTFDFNCWLSDSRPGCEPSKELPAVREGARPLPMEKYNIEVRTGSCYNAGTEAGVNIVLFGDYGDTGPRRLAMPGPEVRPPFQMGQTDTFELEAVYLGRIKKLVIGHDGKGAGYGWFLDSVQVTAASKPDAPVTFLCHRWLDEAEDDGKTTRELRPQEQQQQQQKQAEPLQDPLEKLVWQGLAWLFQPDTVVQLYSRVTGRPLRINSDNTVDASAEDNDPMSFLTVGGKKDSVRTLRADTGPGQRSFLSIDGGQIAGQAKPGPQCELRIRAHPPDLATVSLESARAPLLFVGFSADGRPVDPRQWKGAPPDGPARLFVPHCRGALRDGGIVMLGCSINQVLALDHDNSVHGAGSRGPMAQFRVWRPFDEDTDEDAEDEADNNAGGSVRLFESVVFPDLFLRLKDGVIDCRGSGDVHCYFRVVRHKTKGGATLESVRSPGSFVGLAPDGRATVANNAEGQRETASAARFFIEVVSFGKSKSQQQPPPPQPQKKPPPQTTPQAKPQPEQKPKQPPKQQQQQQKQQEPPDTSRASLKEPYDWLLRIDTEEPCVNADVSLTAYGEQKSIGPILLGSAGGAAFGAATQDEFKIELKDAGPLYKLRLELKPWPEQAEPPAWSISHLLLSRPDTDIDFQIGRCRLGLGEGLETAAEFPTPDSGLQVLQYTVQLATGSEQVQPFQGGLWVCLIGERGDSGRRPCYDLGQMVADDVRELSISAVDLGQLKQCLVSVEAPTAGSGWHCEGVLVTLPTGQQALFACGNWLDPGQGDGKTERLLRLDENLTEDDEMKQYGEDVQQLLIEPSTQTFRDLLDVYAKALIDDIAEQAARRVQELHDAEVSEPSPQGGN